MNDIAPADAVAAMLVGELPPQCQRDLNSLRGYVHAAIRHGAPADPVSPGEFREVLLTGATGFVGQFVLRDLLRQKPDLVVHCLVRANDGEHGFERLRATLEQADIWDETFSARIRVVVGDVAETRFGLDEAEFDDLCRRIDAVYHLAADLTLASPYVAIRRANTFSIRNVLELCLRTRYKHVFFASSMSVFPQYFFRFANEFRDCRVEHQMQPDLASMKRSYPLGLLGYPWTKLVAEQVLLFAHSAGMPVGIFRLPRTSTASTGPTKSKDIAVRLLAAVVDIEAMPRGFSIFRADEAVDALSRICTAISLNPRRRFTIYHCCDPRPPVHELEPRDFGLYWREVPYASFKRACQARGEKSPLHAHWALLDHFASHWFGNRNAGAPLPVCDRAIREDCPVPIEWPGAMTMFRRFSDWIRRPQSRWPYPVRESHLDFDRLIEQAEHHAERVGVDFGQACPGWMQHGLQRLVQALGAPETGLLEAGRSFVVFNLSRILRNNAALARERQQHPEIEREEIARPIFIVGINRTGTTFLHRLMARDERFWTLRIYEFLEPVRPTVEYATLAGTPADPRREALDDILEASGAVENFSGIHQIDIDEPEEDFPLLRSAFASWTTLIRYRLPNYGRWLAATDMRHAYGHHHHTMQHFTWQRRQRRPARGGQWLFKMPFHLMELEALVESYPDALFIQSHREPTQFMGSWNSLVERVRSVTIEPRPLHELGAEQLGLMSGMLNKATRFRENHPELEDRWVDVNYFDLLQDPLAVLRYIYDRFGWKLEQSAVAEMNEWLLRQSEQRRRETRHRYRLEDYALTPEGVNAAFAPYRDFITDRGIRESRL